MHFPPSKIYFFHFESPILLLFSEQIWTEIVDVMFEENSVEVTFS